MLYNYQVAFQKILKKMAVILARYKGKKESREASNLRTRF